MDSEMATKYISVKKVFVIAINVAGSCPSEICTNCIYLVKGQIESALFLSFLTLTVPENVDFWALTKGRETNPFLC